MTVRNYRLPDGTVPVLLTADVPGLLQDEAAAVLGYLTDQREVTPGAVAEMLFRTRMIRRYRALAMVSDRDGLIDALQAIVDNRAHPSVVRTNTAATAHKLAFVFPGQGVQRPGMGRLFYDFIPAFRDEVDRCAETFATQFGDSPLEYLLDEGLPTDDSAGLVQPALFTQMAGLAALWRSSGITPHATIGHSQGEIAAAYVSGAVTLSDAVRVIGIRARAADEFACGDYAMAIIAAGRDACEDLLARCSGWAQLSVINSPNLTGISGDRQTVQAIVDTFTERGTFARIIRVLYPAHTSLISDLGEKMRASTQRELQNPKFLDTDIDCFGSTLGAQITQDLPVEQYWFWNLRNTVRFDRAIAEAAQHDIDTFVELAAHPTLQLAIQDNLAAVSRDTAAIVVGTTDRAATDLGEFTRNLVLLALHDLDYSWQCLGTECDGPAPLPLLDFPNTRMNETRLWLPYRSSAVPCGTHTPAEAPTVQTTPVRRYEEEWIRLAQRSLVPPRVIGVVDHTGDCAELATALRLAAGQLGATARLVDDESPVGASDFTTLAILLPESPKLDDCTAATEVAKFFSERTWWPGIAETVTECWLVTVGGEAVIAGDAPPDPVHAAVSAGFRSIGVDYPRVAFRHLDLPSGSTAAWANEVLAALHTAEESELAVRDGGLYAKRIVPCSAAPADSESPQHVLIVGGTGHLGLEFCDHSARLGARRITLVSRSGETPAVADRLRQIRSASSTQVRVSQCDVGEQAAVARLAAESRDFPADLIIHAAVNYSAVDLADITAESADQALRAKVVGISRVLAAYPRTDNCRVLLCSSARATIGGRGQILYAAANRMLDAMAHRLRAEGLDCVSVQWGQWTVHFDLDDTSRAQLAAIGMVPMAPAEALAVGMSRFRGNGIVLAYDFDRAQPMLEAYGYGPLVSQLTTPDTKAQVPVAQAAISQRVTDMLAEALGIDRAIDTAVPLVALGLDSLQALELRRRVKAEFGHDLDVSDLLGGASLADVLAKLSG